MINVKPYIDELDLLKQVMNARIDLIEYGRRVGNTTRLADLAIQVLFKHGKVVVRDHHRPNGSNEDQMHLFKIITRRLNAEHGLTSGNGLKISPSSLTIKLLTTNGNND